MPETHSAEELAREGGALPLLAPVVEVTVMEDRARVKRQGLCRVPAGRQRLRLMGVAPVLADKTLMVSAEGSKELRVVDARAMRRVVIRTSPESVDSPVPKLAALRQQRKELEREIAAAAGELRRRDEKSQGLVRAARLSLRELVADVAWGRSVADHWNSELRAVRTSYMESLDELVLLRRAHEEREQQLARLDAQIQLLESPAEHEMACVDIDVESECDCECQFSIEYVVPGACWRPYHTAQLVDGEPLQVLFKTDACLWQNTGEDWSEVSLVLSTERASLGAQPPQLQTDSLRMQRKSSTVHIESRDQSVESLVSAGASDSSFRLPGIDDGGAALHIRAPSPCSVRSDGRPHRVFLGSFEATAERYLVAMPEINPCVVVMTTLENGSDEPLLAGPVDLIRNSGLIGQSKILYVASGERFELGWGPEADLRLRREIDSTSESSRALSAWSSKQHTTRIRLSNLGQRPHRVRITERVPVSEIDRVKIMVDPSKTSEQREADGHGFVEWTVDIGALSHEARELHYVVKKHDDVQS